MNENLKCEGQIFSDPYLLEGVNYKTIVFKNCVFSKSISLKKVNANIKFQDCVFEGKVDLFNLYKNISFLYSDFTKKIKLKNLKSTNLEFLETKIDEILISDSIGIEKLQLFNSRTTILTFEKSSAKNIILKSSRIESLDIKSSGESFLDFAGSSISEIHLSSSIKKKIINGNFNDVFKGNKHHYWSGVTRTLLSINNSYENKRSYKDADLIFVKMKYAELRANLNDTRNLFKKIWIVIYYFINRFLFGWGVKLSNVTYLSFLIIISYASFYFFNDNLKHYTKSDAINDKIYTAFYVSVARFFNFGEFAYKQHFFRFFDIQESIIGFILLTLFTAILVRKFIR